VSGLANTRRLLDAIIAGTVHYDFVEVMACPGGCAGGGGQPIALNSELAEERGARLWALDKAAPVRFSHENESVQRLYKEYLDAPCSEKAHHLLHVEHRQQ
jgi:NADH-quinone oxidoreductase subunit G